MNYHELEPFIDELKKLESFFTELAAREDEILTYGIRRVTTWEIYKDVAPFFADFDAKLYELLQFARPIDKTLWESLSTLANQSGLVDSVGKIGISIRIAAHKRHLGMSGELLNSFLSHLPYISIFFKKKRLFEEGNISIQSILVSLGRLISLINRLGRLYISKWSTDDDVFKPSNLDPEKIIVYIENAIVEVENNAPLPDDQKKQLIEYLYKAKSELAEERPSWNNIVGALVIAATLLSGVAAAPLAYENVNNAIKYILGTSVDKHIPTPLPSLDHKRNEGYDKNDTSDDTKYA